jgi:hypothetical protein
LGRYDSKKPSRPLLATLEHTNKKITLFKNFHYAKQNQKYENVSVSNDLSQTEREKEKNPSQRQKDSKSVMFRGTTCTRSEAQLWQDG